METLERTEVECTLPLLSMEPETNMIVGEAHSPHRNKRKKGSSLRCQYRCPMRFRDQDQRKVHYETVHEGDIVPVLSCEICGKTGFKWECTLKQHISNTHSKTTAILMCEYCEKIFTRRDSFKEHLLIHEGPRHKCSHCEKEFVQRSNLIRHERIHTGSKPYKCTFCDASFSDQGACKSHENVHTKLQTCVCTYCGQQFSKQQKLRYHLKKHTGEGLVQCEICRKDFTNGSSLRAHKQIHESREPVVMKCPYSCGKIFTKDKNMKKHVAMTHERVNVHQCQICQRVLSAHTGLRNHMLAHTGVKHIICLICKKSYREMPGFRYHALSKHNIPRKHELFHESYYKLTIKEVGLIERFNRSKKLKKCKDDDNDNDVVLVSDTIESILSGRLDTLPMLINDGETLFETVLNTDETVRKGGKTYLIAPERGIPVPEFYERSAPDKETLDKKINDKHKNILQLIKGANLTDNDNIKTNKKSKLKAKDLQSDFVTVSGTVDRINDLIMELQPNYQPVLLNLDDVMKCIRIPNQAFGGIIDKVLCDYFTTAGGIRLIRVGNDNFKIDNRGRPRGSMKNNDQLSQLDRELDVDIITITGSSTRIQELCAELTCDGEITNRAEVIELEDGTKVIRAERCELVTILDKSHSDAYVTLNGIRLLYVNERTFKIDSRGRKKIKTDHDQYSNLIGHVNENEEIAILGVREKLLLLSKELGEEFRTTDDDQTSCVLRVSKASFNNIIDTQSREGFQSPNGIKLLRINESTYKVDSRGRKKKVVEEEKNEDVVVVKQEFTKLTGDQLDLNKLLKDNNLSIDITYDNEQYYVNIPNDDFNIISTNVCGYKFKKVDDYHYELVNDFITVYGDDDKLSKLINDINDKYLITRDEGCIKIKSNTFDEYVVIDEHDNYSLENELLTRISDFSFRIDSTNNCTSDTEEDDANLVTINGVYCRITEFLELLDCDIKKIDEGVNGSFSISITNEQFERVVKKQTDVCYETVNGLKLNPAGDNYYEIINLTDNLVQVDTC